VLDQVEVARRDAEAGGQRLLRQALLHPEAPDGAPEERAAHRFTSFTEARVKL
jgi:hypothetical protein